MSAMRSIVGAALLGLACAVPIEAPWGGWNPSSGLTMSGSATGVPPPSGTMSIPPPSGTGSMAPPSGTGSMVPPSGSGLPPTSSVNLANVPIQSGNPFSFPLSNGFPNLSDSAKAIVNVLAHGIEPNGGAPTLNPKDVVNFQLIAFNEIFEVAFFTDLIFNVTNNVAGYEVQDPIQRNALINALVAIQAQEELHADNANVILAANKAAPIQPCKYQFPVSDLNSAIMLASTFTDAVLGTLQDVQLSLATNGDAGVVPIIGSVIGQEGEQNGFFRNFLKEIPSAKPFLTRATIQYAFSVLNQMFVVPGSCPNANTIPLPIFTPLTVVTSPIAAVDQLITYKVKADNPMPPSGTALVLINGQETPIIEQVQNPVVANGYVTFQANFPFNEYVLDGFTIAALVNSTTNLTNAEAVAAVTIAGPGIIEIN